MRYIDAQPPPLLIMFSQAWIGKPKNYYKMSSAQNPGYLQYIDVYRGLC